YAKAVSARATLESQLRENEMVQKEFAKAPADAAIYKLLGPVLLRQDTGEARANVAHRIDTIGAEIKRVENQIKAAEERQEKKKLEIVKLQAAFEQLKA
ncbi:hypothetical protein HK405_011726, partial [Cladochytrium tenue]